MLLLIGLAVVHVQGQAQNIDVILTPANGANSGDTVLFIMSGADIPSQAYIPLAQTIQSYFGNDTSLYVGIPAFPFDHVFDFNIASKIKELMSQMQDKFGLTKNNPKLFLAGHSLGGESLQAWTFKYQFSYVKAIGIECEYKGQILLNSYINRKLRNKKTSLLKNYTIPTLTLGGEWDGLVHSTRIIEQYYIQLIWPTLSVNSTNDQKNTTKNIENFPVIMIYGASHMQAAAITGEYGSDIPSFVLKHDLEPIITYDEAHAQYATYISAFMRLQLGISSNNNNNNDKNNNNNMGNMPNFYKNKEKYTMHGSNNNDKIRNDHASSFNNNNKKKKETNEIAYSQYISDSNDFNTLVYGLNQTQYIATPMINAFIMEGYYNFRAPCDCTDLICESQWYCNAGSPWSSNYSQYIISTISDLPPNNTVTLHNTDSFHPTYQVNPIHYAKIYNNCTSIYDKNGCHLISSTVTQNKYNLQDSIIDDGGTCQSAYEMRTKMKSQQSFHKALNLGFYKESFNVCYLINEASINYAILNTPQYILDRYYSIGEYINVGNDIYTRGGPGWTFPPLNQTRVCNQDSKRWFNQVRSQYLYTNLTCFFAQEECGVHYCKVLSPARAMEWIYIESLRFNKSLINIENHVNNTYCA